MSIRRRVSLTAAALLAVLALGVRAQGQAAPAPWPTQEWAVSTPQAQGMDPKALAALVAWGESNQMDSLVVTRNGYIVTEAYYPPFRAGMKHRVNSATKAVVSALIGIAIEQGKIVDASQRLVGYFPGQAIASADERKKAITLQHLLDMTSGLEWIEPLSGGVNESAVAMGKSGDWVPFILNQPMARPPGEKFSYTSGGSHLLSAVLTRQTGTSTLAFAQQNLFGPLGITDIEWQRDPQGIYTGGFGLQMETRDMAKFGYLYLRGGEWGGKQVVPRAWVDKAFRASVPMMLSATTDFRYGDQWWALPQRGITMATGFNRQLIIVMPQSDVVVATTARTNYPFAPMLDLLAAALKPAAP